MTFRLTGLTGLQHKSALAGLTLLVDGVPFAVNDATPQSRSIYWPMPGQGWTDGQRVSLRLVTYKIIYGLRLSDFKVTKGGLTRQPDPDDGRVVERTSLGVTWRAANVFEHCAYRIEWHQKGNTPWTFSTKHLTYETRPGVTLPGLYPGNEYVVRVLVLGPKSQPDIEAFRTTVTTTAGTPGGPPEQRGNPPEKSAPPGVSSAQVDGAALTLAFDADLDGSAVPPGSAFSVKSTQSEHAVSSVAVSGRTVTLALSPAVSAGDAVTMDYLPPSGPGRLRGPRGDVARISGRAVTNATAQAPALAPLTARFEAAPTEHRGKGKFSLRVAFSAPVSGSADAAAFRVTGGTLERVRRMGRRGDRWALTVKPSSHGPVTVTLPATTDCAAAGAVCTADGRRLETALTRTVQGPPALSVSDARAREGEDATIDFRVTLSRAAPAPVTVRYATKNGTAKRGEDFRRATGTLAFAAGETAKTVAVELLDDAHDEGEETFTLRLSKAKGAFIADGEATGTIENDDPMPQAWLARFGRTAAEHVTAAVSGRLATPLAGAQVTVGGQSVDLARMGEAAWLGEAMASVARALGAREVPAGEDDGWPGTGVAARGSPAPAAGPDLATGRELLPGSAFHVAARGGDGRPGLAAWGRVTAGGFDGAAPADGGTARVDGEVTTGTFGADAEWSRLLAGVAVSVSRGEGAFDLPGVDSGTVESSMTAATPYARVMLTERVSAWGLLGRGTGDMTVTQAANGRGQPERVTRSDLSMRLAALGARGALLEGGAGGFDLALRADAFVVETEAVSGEGGTTADASRLRLVLEGSRAFALDGGATVRPALEIGFRHDGGDAETGTGIELGGGVSWSDPASRVTMDLRARTLVAHADAAYREWGVSGAVRVEPDARGRGLSLTLASGAGAESGGADVVWSARNASGLAQGGAFDPSARLEGEVGYGLPVRGGRLTGTPYAGLSATEAGYDARLGWRLTHPGDAGAFGLSLEASRRDADGGDAAHGLGFRFETRW